MSIQRRKSRQVALQALYQNEFTNPTSSEIKYSISRILDNLSDDDMLSEQEQNYACHLIEDFYKHKTEIESLIEKYSLNWKMERISPTVLGILKVAIVELFHRPEVPNKVAINEAIELSKIFDEKKSFEFINGILDKILKSDLDK